MADTTIQSRRRAKETLSLRMSDLIDVRAFFPPSRMVDLEKEEESQSLQQPHVDIGHEAAVSQSSWSPSSTPGQTTSWEDEEEQEDDDNSNEQSTSYLSQLECFPQQRAPSLRLPPRQNSSFLTHWGSDLSSDTESESETEDESESSSWDDDEDDDDQEEENGDLIDDESSLPPGYLAQALPTLSYMSSHNWSPCYSSRGEGSSPEIDLCTPPTKNVKVRSARLVESHGPGAPQDAEILSVVDHYVQDTVSSSPPVEDAITFPVSSHRNKVLTRQESLDAYIVINDTSKPRKATEDNDSEPALDLKRPTIDITIIPRLRLVKPEYDGGMDSVEAFETSTAAFRDYCTFKPDVLAAKLERLSLLRASQPEAAVEA